MSATSLPPSVEVEFLGSSGSPTSGRFIRYQAVVSDGEYVAMITRQSGQGMSQALYEIETPTGARICTDLPMVAAYAALYTHLERNT